MGVIVSCDLQNINEIGLKGEQIVSLYIRACGELILAQRFRGMGYEIDLISLKTNLVTIWEVKTTRKRKDDSNLPRKSLTNGQNRSHTRGINMFIRKNKHLYDTNFQIMFCEVFLPTPSSKLLIVTTHIR